MGQIGVILDLMTKGLFIFFGVFFVFISRATPLDLHPVNDLDFGVLDRGAEGRTIFPEDIQGSAQLYVVGNENDVFVASLEQDHALLESINGDRIYAYGLKTWSADDARLDSLGYGELRVGGKVLNVDQAQSVGRYLASVEVIVKRAFRRMLGSRILDVDAATASTHIRLQIR